MRKSALLVILLPLLLAACASGQPSLVAETESFDFGDVVNGEVRTYDLAIRNEGSAPLVVESVSTSCGCTKAMLEPMNLPPGGSAHLHVVYDSGAHGPELTGKVSRQIFIASNDPERREVVIEFDSNVLPPDGS